MTCCYCEIVTFLHNHLSERVTYYLSSYIRKNIFLLKNIEILLLSQMTSLLYDRIYQRVSSEVDNDEQFCAYLAEICTDPDSHCDDLRDIIDTMFKTSHPKISETRRQHVVYALLDMIEEDRQKQLDKANQVEEDNTEDDLEVGERLERDGECKLCGCEHKITSKKWNYIDFYHL